MPSKRRRKKPGDLSSVVGQADSVYGRLLAFLKLASGFSLAIAVCGAPLVREDLTSQAVSDAAGLGLDVRVVDVSESYSGDFVLAVREKLGGAPLSGRLALMVTGIDHLVYAVDDVLGGRNSRPAFVTRFNFDRERIAAQLPFPLVLWMEGEAFRLLLREAPDLSQWVSARFDFEEVPEHSWHLFHNLMVLDTIGLPEVARLDLASEEALARELQKSTGAADVVGIGKRIILLLTLGQQYSAAGKTAEARRTLREAITLAQRLKAKRVEAASRSAIGVLHLTEGKIKLAIRQLRRALELFQEANDEAVVSVSLPLAEAYLRNRDYGAAILCLRRAIESPAGGVAIKLEALVELGKVHSAAGEKDKAIDAFEEALALMGQQNNPRKNALLLMQMGESVRKVDPKKALDYLERCLPIASRIGDRRLEARCLGSIGWAYEQMKEYRRAISYFERSLAVFQQVGDRDAENSVLPGLLYVLAQVGDFDRAELIARESLERSRASRNRRNEAVFLLALSDIADRKGETQQALETAQAAVEILREIGDPLLENARKCLAWVKGEVAPSTPAPQREQAGPSVAGLSRPR